jgi:hypothetical protein
MFNKAVYITAVLVAVLAAVHFWASMFRRAKWSGLKGRPRAMETLIYLALIGVTAILAGSAIYAMLSQGIMLGWMLWAHLTAAGAFVALLAMAAVLWAEASRFNPGASPGRIERYCTFTKVSYWAMLVSGAVAIATILASMFFLSQHAQELAITIHRYAGLALTAAAVLHLYSLIVVRLLRP